MPKNEKLIENILKRQDQMEDAREPLESIWEEIAYFGACRRPGFKRNQQAGEKHGTKIYDGTPAAALELYVDGIQGYYVSRALEWFNYRIGGSKLRDLNENRDVKIWLQNVREQVYWELNQSNFYDAIREFLLDVASIGNANMFIDEDIPENTMNFLVRHPREVWFMVNSKGEIDIVHRQFELTCRQAVMDFGYENVSLNIQKAYDENNHNQKFEFLQAIYPVNDFIVKEYDPKYKTIKKFKEYISYYIETDQKNLVKRGGFRTLNPVILRAKTYSGEIYGRGILGNAISEVKRLNSASKTEMEIAQLSAEPPLNVPFEMKDNVDFSPRGQNYYRDAGRLVAPIETGSNYPITEEYIQRLQSAIEGHFQIEFFLMLARSEGTMTATEIIEKQGEKVALMSSQLSKLSQVLNKIHHRILNILLIQGKLPTIPPVLLARTGGFFNIDVDYVGPLAQAQKRLFKARGIRQSLEVAAPYMEMFPGFRDAVNDVEMAKEIYTTHGMPEHILNKDEVIKQIRKSRAERNKRIFEAEMAEKEGKVTKNLGSEVEKGSILEKLERAT